MLESSCFACPENEARLVGIEVTRGVPPLLARFGIAQWLVQQVQALGRQGLVPGLKKVRRPCVCCPARWEPPLPVCSVLSGAILCSTGLPARAPGCADEHDAEQRGGLQQRGSRASAGSGAAAAGQDPAERAVAPWWVPEPEKLAMQCLRGRCDTEARPPPASTGGSLNRDELNAWVDELSSCLGLLINLVENDKELRGRLRTARLLPGEGAGGAGMVVLLSRLMATAAAQPKR